MAAAAFDKAEIVDRAQGHWKAIIYALCPDLDVKCLDGRQQACPKCGGTDRFRVFEDFARKGGALCNQCFNQKNGDGFAFLMWYRGWTFPETLQAVAEHLGIRPKETGKGRKKKPPKAVDQPDPNPFDSWEPAQLTDEQLRLVVEKWAATKSGVDVESVLQSGVQAGRWPKGENSQRVIAFTGYGIPRFGESREFGPAAVHIYRADGQDLPAFGYLPERKNHNLGGSANSWLFVGGRDRFERSEVACKVEGLTDAFALLPLLPPHWSVVTMTNGCAWRIGSERMPPLDIFIGKKVVVCGDCDVPGQRGAEAFAADVRRFAKELFMCRLPYAVEPTHGPDLRDWLSEDEQTYIQFSGLLIEWEYLQRVRLSMFGGSRVYRKRTFQAQDMTDAANAQHYAENGRLRLRYVHTWKKWRCWDGWRWDEDDIGRPTKIAKEVSAEVWEDVSEMDFNPMAVRFAQETSNAGRIGNMMKLARDELAIRVSHLDRNRWQFNCINGTVDLRSGRLFEHSQEDYITKLCSIPFDPHAQCPRWLQFLDEVFEGCPDVIPFLARFFGYCLTGETKEQQFPVFWGSGSNGKSTLMNTVLDILGHDYAMQQKADLLVVKKNERHETELAAMYGKRMVVMSETEQNQRLAESKVKALTGGEPVPCRRLYEDQWTYVPEFKFVLVTNHRPQIFGQDYAIWRRLLLVPFEQCFEGERKDPDLLYRLAEEQPGILAWMVRGCMEWQAQGLNAPESIRAATEDYAEHEDIVGRFVRDCCLLGAGKTVRARQLRVAFDRWAEENGEPKLSQKRIAEWLKAHQCEKRTSNGVIWSGVGLVYADMGEPDGGYRSGSDVVEDDSENDPYTFSDGF